MNYQELLKKYIAYIVQCEGIDYIDPIEYRYQSEVKFSDEEWSELEKLAEADD